MLVMTMMMMMMMAMHRYDDDYHPAGTTLAKTTYRAAVEPSRLASGRPAVADAPGVWSAPRARGAWQGRQTSSRAAPPRALEWRSIWLHHHQPIGSGSPPSNRRGGPAGDWWLACRWHGLARAGIRRWLDGSWPAHPSSPAPWPGRKGTREKEKKKTQKNKDLRCGLQRGSGLSGGRGACHCLPCFWRRANGRGPTTAAGRSVAWPTTRGSTIAHSTAGVRGGQAGRGQMSPKMRRHRGMRANWRCRPSAACFRQPAPPGGWASRCLSGAVAASSVDTGLPRLRLSSLGRIAGAIRDGGCSRAPSEPAEGPPPSSPLTARQPAQCRRFRHPRQSLPQALALAANGHAGRTAPRWGDSEVYTVASPQATAPIARADGAPFLSTGRTLQRVLLGRFGASDRGPLFCVLSRRALLP